MAQEHWLWLAHSMGFGANIRTLIDIYKDAENIYDMRDALLKDGLVTKNQYAKMQKITLDQMAQVIKKHNNNGFLITCHSDIKYPPQLRQIDNPPAVLYYKGDIMACQNVLNIAVVGSRSPSAYGIEAAKAICDSLAKAKCVIISGLAAGLDSEAHKSAVNNNAPTVAVLGTAIDVCYPAQNHILRNLIENNGVVISEYPMGTDGLPTYFVLRNRIIAGIAQGICVIEARLKSGTMSTVNFALDFGRDIFSVPGSIFSKQSEGTNLLLSQGATPVCKPQDILNEYGITINGTDLTKQSVTVIDNLSGSQKDIYNTLSATPISLEQICEKTKLSPSTAMAQLTVLELDGAVKQMPGRCFMKTV